ncbi:FKBP12-associated protein [Vanrija albida]|uniref:FKBP12-associated protein n=1 Tax=Vanrija albida TaxID=181172 RepID=A0ABR3Q2D7_9TREE
MTDTATYQGFNQPQPGDGAYLARPTPQPGDGAYLTQSAGTTGTSQPATASARQQPGQNNGRRQQQQGKGRRGGRAPNGSSPDTNGDLASATASLSIEEVGAPAKGGRGQGRRLNVPGGFSDRLAKDTDERPQSAGNKRSNQNKDRRRQRVAAGHAENLEENRSLGLGGLDNGIAGNGSGSNTPLNPGAASFSPAAGLTPPSGPSRAESPAGDGGRSRNNNRRKKAKETDAPKEDSAPAKPVSSRRAAFEKGSKLTTSNDKPRAKANDKDHGHSHSHEPRGNEPDDLNSRLTRGLRNKPFIECPICFAPIFAQQQTWSCLPPHSPPEYPSTLDEDERPKFAANHYTSCYTPFHISCIRDWASRSLHDDTQRITSNGSNDEPAWRCPGCQKKRTTKVGGYRCFCGRLASPPTTASAPHSCNDACARQRPNCDHPCPLNCHPGPCPPCQVALVVRCPSHGTALTVKCAAASVNDAALTPVCDEPCPGQRSCGKHECDRLCHFGPCAPCEEVETVRCYCGHDEKVVPCGWNLNDKKMCATADESWEGRFACDRVCNIPYECGIHTCKDKCHPHSVSPRPCPTSPSVITTCPCGQTPLSVLPGYPRPDCFASIPTCGSSCPKTRPCGHKCPLKCHEGPCPPCHESVYRPCRCGESTLLLDCDEVRERNDAGQTNFFCERVCKALRNCGRHECGRVCCPLSYKAKRKGRRALDDIDTGDDDLHACALTCGKTLSCGTHTCPRPDHKGACGRCLQASYDELICNCGHTVIYPPVACGTKITCVFPCGRPDPPCGHPKSQHNCHEEPECPPCPFLTTKPCACGKDPAVKNVRCSQSQDRVSCGQVCGKLLGCGYHRCEKTCHPGDCDSCTQTCNKPKRICKHACTATCHAPAKCPESEACSTIITQSCACGHLQQRASCGANTANPSSRESVQLKCNSECMVRQRNARLADALGIKQPVDRTLTEWTPELRTFARANPQFVIMVEQTFRDFFQGARQTLILPHMPVAKRTFVMSLADAYHLGRELIDAEPNRSVQIRRRIDTRIPNPLLSAAAPPLSKPGLGGLGNLRATTSPWGASRPGTSTPPTAAPAASAASAVKGIASSVPTSRITTPQASNRPTPSSSPPAPAASTLPPAPILHPLPIPVSTPRVVDDDDWDQSGDEA